MVSPNGTFIALLAIFSCVSMAHFRFQNDDTADERTVRAGENISFNCVASSLKVNISIEWKTPCSELVNGKIGFVCKNQTYVNQTGIGGLKLTLESANYLDAGFYVCQSSEGSQIFRRIYLFVKGDQHLLIPPITQRVPPVNSSYFEMPLVFGQRDVLIGCAPTHPENLVMTLTSMSGNTTLKHMSVDARYFSYVNEKWSYHRYHGFSIKKVQSWENILYRCSASLFRRPLETFMSKNDSDAALLHTEYLYIYSEISGIEIMSQDPPGLSVKERDEFHLKCRGKGEATMDLKWKWVPALEPLYKEEPVEEKYFKQLIPGIPTVEENEESFADLGRFHTSSLLWTRIPRNASGFYICYDRSNKNLPVSSVKLTVVSSEPDILATVTTSGSTFKILCNVSIHQKNITNLEAGIQWKFPPGEAFDEQIYYKNATTLRKRMTEYRNKTANMWAIVVRNASYLDTGLYSCSVNLGNVSVSHTYSISVRDPWYIMLPPTTRLIETQENKVVFYFSTRNALVGCAPTDSSIMVILRRDYSKMKGVTVASSKTYEPSNSDWVFDEYRGFKLSTVDSWLVDGDYMCVAKRMNKTESEKSTIQYARFKIAISGVEILASNQVVVEGDSLNLTCRGRNARGNTSLEWRWTPHQLYEEHVNERKLPFKLNRALIQGLDGSVEQDSNVEYSTFGAFDVSRLMWTNVPFSASGYYECRDANDQDAPPATVNLVIQKPTVPRLLGDNEETRLVDRWEDVTLQCIEKGALPVPRVRWFLSQEPNNEIELTNDLNHGKLYVIISSNHQSELLIQKTDLSATYKCRFENWQGAAEKTFYVDVKSPKTNIYFSVSLVTFFVSITLAGLIIRKFYRQKGSNEKRLRRRAELLKGSLNDLNRKASINSQVELLPYDPKWEFPIDRLVLGKHLGSGHYGQVVQAKADGISGPGVTTVAVKMVKSRNNNGALKSLVSELKVLMHLGSHLNVVSLFGAVTKNIVKGELMVIVELCRNGNLRDFLRNNRHCFKNQLDDEGNLKPLDYATLESRKDKSKKKTEAKRDVTTHDLIEWSFQIACGMNYLTKKKVLHGDLAARNVLLADDNVVKIADFGLSRRFNQHGWNYRKRSKEALPFKWMALESLLDRNFSSQSDVWSFGVTLWELFSLSKEPYPDIDNAGELIRFLRNSQRMEKPQFAPNNFVDILTSCWSERANERKTFSDLERVIGEMLDTEIRAQYEKAYDQFGYIGFNAEEDLSLTESSVSSVEYLELTQCDHDGEIENGTSDHVY